MTKQIKKGKNIRYRLYVLNPITKKWGRAEQGKTLKAVAKKMGLNLMMNKEWYTHEGKRLKLRLVCEEVKGKEIKVWEEYKITKNWQVKGYFDNWGEM